MRRRDFILHKVSPIKTLIIPSYSYFLILVISFFCRVFDSVSSNLEKVLSNTPSTVFGNINLS